MRRVLFITVAILLGLAEMVWAAEPKNAAPIRYGDLRHTPSGAVYYLTPWNVHMLDTYRINMVSIVDMERGFTMESSAGAGAGAGAGDAAATGADAGPGTGGGTR